MPRAPTGRHLSERSLRQLASGERGPGPWMAKHLGACGSCRDELALRRGVAGAAADARPGEHPDDQELVLLAAGRLRDDGQRRALDDHLTGCGECAVLFEDLVREREATAGRGAATAARAVLDDLAARLRALVGFEMPVAVAVAARGDGAPQHGMSEELLQGIRAYRNDGYAAALVRFERAADAGEAFPELPLLRGACLLQAGRAPEAVELLAGAVRRDPADDESRWYLAQAWLACGEGARAIDHLHMVARRPGTYREQAAALLRRVRKVGGNQ